MPIECTYPGVYIDEIVNGVGGDGIPITIVTVPGAGDFMLIGEAGVVFIIDGGAGGNITIGVEPLGISSAKVAAGAITYAKIQNVTSSDRLLGRQSAGAGPVEEITCTPAGRALLGDADAAAQRATLGLGTLATQNGTVSGTNTGDQTITLTGDVSGSGTGNLPAAIQPNAVTYAKMQDVSATQRALGRNSAGAGDPEELTISQLLDWVGSARGAVLFRGATGWSILSPGAAGSVLTSNGIGADPSFQAVSGGGAGSDPALSSHTVSADTVVASAKSAVFSRYMEVAPGVTLEVAPGADLEVL